MMEKCVHCKEEMATTEKCQTGNISSVIRIEDTDSHQGDYQTDAVVHLKSIKKNNKFWRPAVTTFQNNQIQSSADKKYLNLLEESYNQLNNKYDGLNKKMKILNDENQNLKQDMKFLKKQLEIVSNENNLRNINFNLLLDKVGEEGQRLTSLAAALSVTNWATPDYKQLLDEKVKSVLTNIKSRYLWCALIVVLLIIGITTSLLIIYPPNGDTEDWDSEVSENTSLRLYTRNDWEAVPARHEIKALRVNPPHYVIIAHTAGSNCTTFGECSRKVRDIQMDQMGRGWDDMGMHFLVGGDGAAYTGLGWGKHGAHTIPFNARSIVVYFIGTFMFYLPPKRQIRAAKLLIEEGVKMGKIASDYKLFAHKQVWATESPGAALIADVKKWPHWATYEISDD